MSASHEFLKALAIVIGVAAVTTVVFQRLRQPVVLGYILAGLIVGPHVPVPLVADRGIVETLSELGVILLMFSLGLEFSLRKLIRVGATAGLTAVIQSSLMVWLGYLAGRSFGWSQRESIFAGAIIAISSTTIIAKAFDEQRIRGAVRDLVVGILIAEDLIGILLMTVLTAVTAGDVSGGAILRSAARLAGFLAVVLVSGVLIIPRLMRAVVRLQRAETTLVASIGICFLVALAAQSFGYSVALGAFLAGSLIAESGQENQVEHLVAPVRDMFAAVFFVSVGMMLDPATIVKYWLPVVVFVLLVVVGKVLGVTTGAFLTGNGVRTSVQAGMSLAQIGEFSFIIAALGISLRATGDFLYSIAVAVSTITTLTTPWLIRSGERAARAVERSLPDRLQTFAALYGSWLEGLRTRQHNGSGARLRRLIKLLILDGALLAAVLLGASRLWQPAASALTTRLDLPWPVAGIIVGCAAAIVALPFVFGVARLARALAVTIAERALPRVAEGTLDLAAAPRKAMVVSIQLVVILLIGMPVLALVQPFVSGWGAATVFLVAIVALGILLWRTTRGLQGHVRAGAELVIEMLTAQARKGGTAAAGDGRNLLEVGELLPGLGNPTSVRLPESCVAVGKSLAELNLRGATGASVLAIVRGETGVTAPGANERLRAGDILALVGTADAVATATALLTGDGRDTSPPSPAGD